MQIGIEQISSLGSGLQRPECVLGTANGDIFASNWKGGVSQLKPSGEHRELLASNADWLRPNGIALRQTGTFLLAHLGDDSGGVFELSPDGSLTDFLLEVDGTALPPTNFVTEDGQGRAWITVSTRLRPRARGYRREVTDGFIVLVDESGARIVADNLGYTNEAQVHPSGSHLYVNETFAKRISRFRIGERGSLGPRETVAEFGRGTFPDGLVFDEVGGMWLTSIISNRLIHLQPDGTERIVIEDSDDEHLDLVEAAYLGPGLGREHLDNIPSTRLRNISSLAFTGPDRKTATLGCLLGDSVSQFRAPIAGAEPPHWRVVV